MCEGSAIRRSIVNRFFADIASELKECGFAVFMEWLTPKIKDFSYSTFPCKVLALGVNDSAWLSWTRVTKSLRKASKKSTRTRSKKLQSYSARKTKFIFCREEEGFRGKGSRFGMSSERIKGAFITKSPVLKLIHQKDYQLQNFKTARIEMKRNKTSKTARCFRTSHRKF